MSAVGARAVLRIARRDAARYKGRSLLVVLMIALPVFAVTGVDVLARTAQLDPADLVAAELGERADAAVTLFDGQVQQSPDGVSYNSGRDVPGPAGEQVTVGELFPGRPVLPDRRDRVGIQTAAGASRVELRELDYRDPLAAGLVTQLAGRAPRSADEVALTPALSQRTAARVGDTVQLLGPDRRLTVVGLVDPTASRRNDEVVLALPGAVLPQVPVGGLSSSRYLVDTAEPVGWQQVLQLNDRGAAVVSRAVLLDPPPRNAVPYYQGSSSGPSTATLAAVVLAAGMALLEVVLLAGPAFAVGARRSRRSLALLAATGGERRHVRGVVLGQGLVLGVVAAVAGVALGVAVAAAAVPVLTRRFDAEFGSFDVRPLELLAIAAVGVVTAVLAAVVPARGAARQDVVAALAGRRGQVATARRVPVIGVLMVAAGVAVAAAGAVRQSAAGILAGSALAELGLVVCSPTLVGLAGRAGRFLPLTPRLALRDASRNRSRTAPAVSAVMAAVAGSVAAGIYVASQSAHDQLTYTPSLPVGYASVDLHGGPDGPPDVDVEALRAAVAPALPVTSTTVLRSTSPRGGTSINVFPILPPQNQCPLFTDVSGREPTQPELTAVVDDPRCAGFSEQPGGFSFAAGTLVDDGTALAALTGLDNPAVRQVLRDGGAVVFDPLLVQDGQVQLALESYVNDGGPQTPGAPKQITVQRWWPRPTGSSCRERSSSRRPWPSSRAWASSRCRCCSRPTGCPPSPRRTRRTPRCSGSASTPFCRSSAATSTATAPACSRWSSPPPWS